MIPAVRPQNLLIILILLLSACDWGRTPSSERFAKNCNVELPADVKVIADEYEGIVDYHINYKIELTKPEMNSFISGIKRSNNYHIDPPGNGNDTSSKLLDRQYKEGTWYKANGYYRFFRRQGGNSYRAEAVTISSTVDFEEFGM